MTPRISGPKSTCTGELVAGDGPDSETEADPSTSSWLRRLSTTVLVARVDGATGRHGMWDAQESTKMPAVAPVRDPTPSGNASCREPTLSAGNEIAAYDAPPSAIKRATVATTFAYVSRGVTTDRPAGRSGLLPGVRRRCSLVAGAVASSLGGVAAAGHRAPSPASGARGIVEASAAGVRCADPEAVALAGP